MKLNQSGYGPGRATRPVATMATASFVVGGLLVIWSSYVHFHLWQKLGYRHIPTIGPMFLLQSVAGLVLGVLAIAIRRVWAAALAAGCAAATMVGFLVTVEHGLFGFRDSWTAPYAGQAFVIEVAAVVLLFLAGCLCAFAPAAPGRVGPSAEHLASTRV